MPSAHRSRRSRAPSPESTKPTTSDLFSQVARGLLEYSLHQYLARRRGSSSPRFKPSSSPPSSTKGPASMPSSPPPSSSRRASDPTHELLSHLLRGAAALAARHFLFNRGAKKTQRGEEEARPRRRANDPEARRRRHRHHHHHHRHRPRGPDQGDGYRYGHAHAHAPPPPHTKTEILAALDGASAELARTAAQVRRLAGAGRPHRHRDGRCDVYEGLVGCAGRLEAEVERVRAGVVNIRNLGGREMEGLGGREAWGRRDGRGGEGGAGARPREGSYVRVRPEEGVKVPEGEGRRVRSEGGNRGRTRTRSR